MCRFCVALILTVASVAAFAGPRGGGPGARGEDGRPNFRCQLGQRLGTELDSLRLIVAVSVPYGQLVFLRSDSGFAADFELVTTVLRQGDTLYAERISTGHVSTRVYAETSSRVRNAVHVDEFLVPPGDYRARVTLTTDRAARRKSQWEGTISLAPSDPLLRLSDIFWVSEDAELAELGAPRLVESFSTSDVEARARVQLFSSAAEEIRMIWTVLGEASDTARYCVIREKPTGNVQTSEYTLEVSGLTPQTYILRLEAEGNGRRETRQRSFSVRIPGIPLSITDLDLAIRQLKYIATPEEMSRFRAARPMDRERLFKEFWNRRDPTAGSDENELLDEYYLRVEYANAKFGGTREGWESDRGRVFINYGEPTDIERHPFEAGSRPYEIWFYSHLGLRFMFVDYTGFGDYQLATPEWGY